MIQIIVQYEKGFAHPKNHPTGLQVPNHHALFTNLPAVLQALGDQTTNVYYTLAHHGELGKSLPSRDQKTFEYQTVLPFDIDHCDLSRPLDYLAVVAGILAVKPADLTLVSTGNGLHILSNLATPIRSAKYQKELKPAYNEIIRKIAQALALAGLPGKPDPVVFDAARVFRLPETINRKPNSPDKYAKLIQYSPTVNAIDLMVLSGVAKLEKENISPTEIRRQFPKPDFAELYKECRFVQWALEKPGEVHEPQIFDLFSLLGAQAPGSKITYQGAEMSAREVGALVMENATASKSCARQDFDRKWEDSSRYGARKCSTISGNWIGGCEACPHHQKIPTPLALKSLEHIGSDENGFWVMGSKGQFLHPHYGDLTRVYSQQKQSVTTDQERLFAFEEKTYLETQDISVEAWAEKTVIPSDPLRSVHRGEFVKKVKVMHVLSKEEEFDLFEKSIRGKLNCRNGVVDIVQGVMLPHSPNFGFRYVLPYDYVEGESSELFLDWLATITENRTELMEALLDIMAYCLWPSYDDHVFAYLVGEGANGKSTLVHIIQAMLGRENFSAVSIQQLGGNRFAPANLEGKLANLSEESSGYEMTFEEMNVIKNLSSGGEMMAERKGTQGFTFHNKAKLIFSANKPPRFKESGIAIQRRMLAIPFDHLIKNPDPRVERALIEDVPKIVSMLVRRIQENIKQNNGRFVVSRGGKSAHDAQEKILLAGNSVVEWAKEEIEHSSELSEDSYVSVTEAYARYGRWSALNNYKIMNKGQFGFFMSKAVLTCAFADGSKVIRVAGKVSRVYPRTKWKELEL